MQYLNERDAMSQGTKPAPFSVGDHVRYIGNQSQVAQSGESNAAAVVLTPGMEGVIVLSTGAFSDEGEAAPNPWRCEVQFENGYHFVITPKNYADFEKGSDADSLTLSNRVSSTAVKESSHA